MEKVEGVIKKLRELAVSKPLSPQDQEAAKECMRALKRWGFTSEEISELSGRAWDASTIRSYTLDVKVEDIHVKARAIDLVVKMIEKDLSLNEVEASVSFKITLDSQGINLEDLLNVLKVAKNSNVNLQDLLGTVLEMINSKASVTQLKDALGYRSNLEGKGFSLENLGKLHDVCEKYGSCKEVLNALTLYGSAKEIERRISELQSKENSLKDTIKGFEERISKLRQEAAKVKEGLDVVSYLKSEDVHEYTLVELQRASERFGGIYAVLAAISKYTSFLTLEEDVSRKLEQKDLLTTEIKVLQGEKDRIADIFEMCTTLRQKLHYGYKEFAAVFEAARKYGDPLNVLEAVAEYNDIKNMDAAKKEMESSNKLLEDRNSQLKEKLSEAEGALSKN